MSIEHSEIRSRLTFGLSDRMDKALKVSGVSSQDMAEYLGVSRTTISNWINGRTPVKKQTLRLWALRTGAPYSWLETGVLEEKTPPGDDPKGQSTPGAGSGRKGLSNLYNSAGSGRVVELWPASAPAEPLRRTA